jgi:hypothetical protein
VLDSARRIGQPEVVADAIEVIIGTWPTDCVVLRFLGKEFPEATDYWDGNWLCTRILATIPGFSGDVTTYLRTPEVAKLCAQLEKLREDNENEATFEMMEPCLSLHFQDDRRGHITVAGEMFNRAGPMGAALRFQLTIDSPQLQTSIDALHAVEAKWPILDRP